MQATVNGVTVNINANTLGFNTAMQSLNMRLNNMQTSVAAVNTAMRHMAMGGIAAVGGLATSAIRFDKAFTDAALTITDLNNDVEGYKTSIIQLAANTTHSATEIAQSFEYMGQAGLDLDTIFGGAAKVVSDFARVGKFSLNKATDLLTDADTALGKSLAGTDQVERMRTLSDALITVSRISNTSAEQASLALTNQAAAAARAYGIQHDELLALIALYAKQGLKGREAGTRVSQTLRYMTQAAHKNKAAFDAMGIEMWTDGVFDMEKAMRSLNNALNQKGGKEGIVATLQELGFGARVQQGIFPMLDMAEEFTGRLADIRKGVGATQKAIDDWGDSLTGKLTIALKTFTNVLIVLGRGLEPLILLFIAIVQPIMDMVMWLNTTSPTISFLISLMTTLAAATTLALSASVLLTLAYLGLTGAMISLFQLMGWMSTSMTGAAAAQFVWSKTWQFLRIQIRMTKRTLSNWLTLQKLQLMYSKLTTFWNWFQAASWKAVAMGIWSATAAMGGFLKTIAIFALKFVVIIGIILILESLIKKVVQFFGWLFGTESYQMEVDAENMEKQIQGDLDGMGLTVDLTPVMDVSGLDSEVYTGLAAARGMNSKFLSDTAFEEGASPISGLKDAVEANTVATDANTDALTPDEEDEMAEEAAAAGTGKDPLGRQVVPVPTSGPGFVGRF